MDAGFIRDKLEIKFLILYITARISEPITLAELQELTMIDSGVNYFSFSECLEDLVGTEHLLVTEDGLYCVTPKGLRNSEICQSSLPYSVRLLADKKLADFNRNLLRRNQVQSSVTPRNNGTFTVQLSLHDDVDSVMELELMVATEEMARDLAERFKKNPEKLYSGILSALFDEK